MKSIKVIDSHTGGEPTRIIVDGGPDLGTGDLAIRLDRFRDEFDSIRSAVVNEPRGSDVIVGGLLCEPTNPSFATGIIFFNNAGYLGMCGHGTIGLMVTLKHLGLIEDGSHNIETPVGPIVARLSENQVTVANVPSYRFKKDVEVEVPGYGKVVGDIAWGGNWFFLVKNSEEKLLVQNARHLTEVTLQIRTALESNEITGAGGAWIDHVELFGNPLDPNNNSRNFVLCPGGAYDRSPCGTGTSAKLACLAADRKLGEGEIWRQESIVGSVFECTYETLPSGVGDPATEPKITPSITGQAFISGESNLILNPEDPFCMGIPQ